MKAMWVAKSIGVKPGVVLGIGILLFTGVQSSSAQPERLTYVTFGGAYLDAQKKAWLDPYAQKVGVAIVTDSPPEYAKLRAMVEAGQVTWDVVEVEGDFGLGAHAKWLEPIDYSIVPKHEILKGFASEYRVAHILFSTVLAYNTVKTGGRVPQGWADFFDLEKFPGKRGITDRARTGLLELALLADGVPPDKIYPLDVKRALRKLDTIKPHLVFYRSAAQGQDLIATGEVTMIRLANGRAAAAKKAGQPVEIQWNQHILQAGYLTVPKGTPNKQAAMRLIAYVVGRDSNGLLSKYITYAPTNIHTAVDAAARGDLPTSHLNIPYVAFNDQYWADNFDTIDAEFQRWKRQ